MAVCSGTNMYSFCARLARYTATFRLCQRKTCSSSVQYFQLQNQRPVCVVATVCAYCAVLYCSAMTRPAGPGDRGMVVRSPVGTSSFSVIQILQTSAGAHPPSRATDTRGLLLRTVNLTSHLQSTAEVKNEWSYTRTPSV